DQLVAVVERVARVRGPAPREDREDDGGDDAGALDHRARRPAGAGRARTARSLVTEARIAPMAGGHASTEACPDPRGASRVPDRAGSGCGTAKVAKLSVPTPRPRVEGGAPGGPQVA